MPTYDYKCLKCGHGFCDIRSISDYAKNPEAQCPECFEKLGRECRDFSKTRQIFSGTRIESAEFNPGLGTVTRSKAHREEILRERNLVEVGNDFGSGKKQQDHFDQTRRNEREKRWRDPGDFFL